MKRDEKDPAARGGRKPFFARLLEAQELEQVAGGKGLTRKAPSDKDEIATTEKAPSDCDEYFTTMKYPSDGDDDAAAL